MKVTTVSVIALAVSIFSIFWNYYANVRHQIFLEKLRVYSGYLKTLASSAITHTEKEQEEIQLKHLSERQEILLFGSKNVAKLVSEIEPVDLSVPGELSKYYDVINAMRSDLIKTNRKLSKDVMNDLIGSHDK